MLPLYHFLSLLPFLLSSRRTKKFEDTFKEIKEMKIVNTLISNNLHMISQKDRPKGKGAAYQYLCL